MWSILKTVCDVLVLLLEKLTPDTLAPCPSARASFAGTSENQAAGLAVGRKTLALCPVGLTRGRELRPRRSWESWEAPGSPGREPCNLAERLIRLRWVLLEGAGRRVRGTVRPCTGVLSGACGGVSPEQGDE